MNALKCFELYQRGYALSRARAQIPADELPKSASPSQKMPVAKLAELTAFALGVGDGPASETPDTLNGVCVRITKALEADAAVIAALNAAEEKLNGAALLGDVAGTKGGAS